MRAAMIFITVTVTLDFLAFGIIAPVLPDLIKQFEGGNIARASDMVGYFGLIWNLMQFLFLPVLGAWSDRFGRQTGDPDFVFGVGTRLYFYGDGAVAEVVICGAASYRESRRRMCQRRLRISRIFRCRGTGKRFGMLGAAFGVGSWWVRRWAGCWDNIICGRRSGQQRR